LATASPLHLEESWRNALTELFSPLQFAFANDEHAEKFLIANNGSTLVVPSFTGDGPLRLQHANHGRRLFVEDDRRDAETLWSLFAVVRDSLNAREHGADNERDRIRRDIHDDLGAKLLSILHRSNDDEQRGLARDALSDLRDLLRSMESGPTSLLAATELWSQETRKRCAASMIRLQWNADSILDDLELSPEQYSNLTRILREAITNCLRHARPTCITVTIDAINGELTFSVDNDGYQNMEGSTRHSGRGIQIIRHRTQLLGGSANISDTEGVWRVSISVPIPNPSMTSAPQSA